MRSTIIILVLALSALMVVPALAGLEKSGATRMDIETFMRLNDYELRFASAKSFLEGFESGEFPAEWTVGVTNGDNTWGISNLTGTPAVEGMRAAFAPYDVANPSNETLSFDYMPTAGDHQLSFWMGGSRSHDWAANVAETVEVDGTEVFDFDSATETDYTMERFDVDLSAWHDQTVTITFRYQGIDGDLHVLDAVTIDDGTGFTPPPPVVPDNDVCETAIHIGYGGGEIVVEGRTNHATNDYDFTAVSCTGFIASGGDVVYIVPLNKNNSITVTMWTDGYDDSIYLVTDCADIDGSCVIGADLEPDGSTFDYTNNTGSYQEYYLIVDGYDSGGAYSVFITYSGTVPTSLQSWGSLKALYR